MAHQIRWLLGRLIPVLPSSFGIERFAIVPFRRLAATMNGCEPTVRSAQFWSTPGVFEVVSVRCGPPYHHQPLSSGHAVPVPQYDEVFYRYDRATGKLIDLERQVGAVESKPKALGFAGYKASVYLRGAHSSVRFQEGDPLEFVFSLPPRVDPHSVQFLVLRISGNRREFVHLQSNRPSPPWSRHGQRRVAAECCAVRHPKIRRFCVSADPVKAAAPWRVYTQRADPRQRRIFIWHRQCEPSKQTGEVGSPGERREWPLRGSVAI